MQHFGLGNLMVIIERQCHWIKHFWRGLPGSGRETKMSTITTDTVKRFQENSPMHRSSDVKLLSSLQFNFRTWCIQFEIYAMPIQLHGTLKTDRPNSEKQDASTKFEGTIHMNQTLCRGGETTP